MAIEVKLPDLGDGIESGDVLDVFVSEGDTIEKNQDVIEIETDKATTAVPASDGGKVSKVHVKTGDTVGVGDVILTLEAAEASGNGSPAPAEPESETPPEPESAAAEERPESAEPQRPSPPEAQPSQERAPAPTQSADLPQISRPARPQTARQPNGATESVSSDLVPAGPAVRRFAREAGVDLANVEGTGPGGRITREDVVRTLKGETATPAPSRATATPAAQPVTPPGDAGTDDWGPTRVEPMSKIRKTIANQMHASWSSVPRVTNFDDADVTEMEQVRQANKEAYAAAGVKLTTMPFLVKAVALALKSHPTLNATIDMENQQVLYKEYVNIGIAIDTEKGLIVPALRNVDRTSIPEIARQMHQLADNVRSGNFSVSDLRGGTFTISNLGAIGGTYSSPIVNIPEVAILLVGRSRKLPVVMEDDSIQPRLMMPLSLSYDHRLVDGAAAARFLNDVITYLENPGRLLLAP